MFLIIYLFAICFTILTEIWFIIFFRKKCYLILTFQLYLAFSYFFQIFLVVLILDFFAFSINQQIADFVFFLQRVKIVFGLIPFFLICFSSVKKRHTSLLCFYPVFPKLIFVLLSLCFYALIHCYKMEFIFLENYI